MQEDRKTLEQRATMTDIERLRHSASHVLATAILKIWPEAQFAAGPPVENGFYYDVDLPHRISPDDFEKIEAEMKKEIKANHSFERMEVSRCSRKRRSATIANSDANSNSLSSTMMWVPACRCFSRAVLSSRGNSKSSQKKPSSPPVINASAHRISHAKVCTKRAVTSPTT